MKQHGKKLADIDKVPVETSLDLLDSLHQRLVTLFRTMDDAAFLRHFVYHPALGKVRLDAEPGAVRVGTENTTPATCCRSKNNQPNWANVIRWPAGSATPNSREP